MIIIIINLHSMTLLSGCAGFATENARHTTLTTPNCSDLATASLT